MIQRAFSIVEMLVVLLIASIMIAIALPAFDSIAAGSGVKTGARNIGSLCSLARQYAVAKRSYTAVIMPGAETGSGVHEDDQYRVMRLAYVTFSNGTYTFDSWIEQSAWLYLPNGTAMMEADDDLGIHDGVAYVKLPVDNGFTQVDDVDLTSLAGNSDVDDVRALVFDSTGKVRGDTRYLTLGEATRMGSFWQVRNAVQTATNESCANQITLEFNRFTGSVTYLTPEKY